MVFTLARSGIAYTIVTEARAGLEAGLGQPAAGVASTAAYASSAVTGA